MAFLEPKIMKVTELVVLLEIEIKKKNPYFFNLTGIHVIKIFHAEKLI